MRKQTNSSIIEFYRFCRTDVIKGIFKSEGIDIFIKYFKNYLLQIKIPFKDDLNIPKEIIDNHIFGSFIELVKYWVSSNFKETPEEMTKYYLKLIPNYGND